MRNSFHTIGHSTHSIEEFVGLLRSAGVAFVVDVRTVPRSRRNPQYDQNVLAGSLASFEIGYERIATLGGLRGRNRSVPRSVNAFWRNESFHNYADYAMGDSFRVGLARLRELGLGKPCVIMCAEILWWRCHRRIVADYLLSAGERVFHVLGPAKVEAARMTGAARMEPSGSLTYPATDPSSH